MVDLQKEEERSYIIASSKPLRWRFLSKMTGGLVIELVFMQSLTGGGGIRK
jgi:hypothetical protein